MELYQLEQFKAAAELSHITKAAELLSISQPALSKNIRILEQELGYPLFDHVGKHVQLNENGRVLLKYVNEIFCSLENAKRAAEMEPDNLEYRRLLEQLRGGGDFYDNYTTTYTTGVNPSNLCMTMCALNFCLGPLCGWRFICC